MAKIEKLTPEQEARLPIVRQHWRDNACDGRRTDRAELERALGDAYAEIGKSPPKLLIFESPTTCMMALKVFSSPELDRQLGQQLRQQLDQQLGQQIWQQLDQQLRQQLDQQLWQQLWQQLDQQLRQQLDRQLWQQLWQQLDQQLWQQLDQQLWQQLDQQLDQQLRQQLDQQLRRQLGQQIWQQLGRQPIYNPDFLWGSQDGYWIAWGLFAEEIGVKLTPETHKTLHIMARISSQCEWWWPYENIVITSQRPTSVKWDDERRLHCETGKAVTYADGTGLSAWHGQAIPDEWVAGKPPAPGEALHWPNMDQRAAACEIVGWHNILDQLNARTVDDSGEPAWGRLVEVDLPDGGRERFLDALCGTGRRFALPVPPETNSVDAAQSILHGGLPVGVLKNCHERT